MRKNLILLVISSTVFFVSAFWIIKILFYNYYLSDINIRKAREIYYSESEEDEMRRRSCSETLKRLLEINQDIKGWIKIDDTNMDYPVLQSDETNKTFYLGHDYKKNKSLNGSIFVNGSKRFSPRLRNTALHGHNLRNGKMFGMILKYDDIEFYKKHPIIFFDTIYGPTKWKIFALIKINTRPEQGEIFDYLKPQFRNSDEFLNFVEEIQKRSQIRTSVDVNESDRILTLSTCSYEMKDFRTALFAREIRKGESETVDIESATKNPDPLMPVAWYNKIQTKTTR
jgi:sortase B